MVQPELDFLHIIQYFRTPQLDNFFKALNFLDRQEFFFILIPLIWLSQGWKSGLRLFYILVISSLANHFLKQIFMSPRPFFFEPDLSLVQVSGYGFPSGAAQSAALLSGILLLYFKTPWKWPIAAIYFALLSFSRLYLGVHFPRDLFGGWAVGLGLLALYVYAFPLIEMQLKRLKPLQLFLLSQAIPLALFTFQSSLPVCSLSMGLGLGLYISQTQNLFLSPAQNRLDNALRISVSIACIFAAYSLTAWLPEPLRFFLLGLWMTPGSQIVCNKLFSTKIESNV